MALYQVDNSVFPATLIQAGIKLNASTSFYYILNSDSSGYCLAASNGGNQFYLTNNNNAPRAGSCPLIVSTLAGSTSGSADGQGTAAQFYEPTSIVLSPDGNLYVADYSNNEIRKVTQTGYVTTFAGATTAGAVDGTGTSARFNHPGGLAVDSAGNLYVADQDNSRIRKISTSGIVSTFAGSGNKSSNDGSGTTASFASPHSVSFDAAGNLYVGDEYSHKVRKITPDGIVATLAGTVQGYLDGSSSVAEFSHPLGIVAAPSGIVYVVERGNDTVRVIQYQ